MKVSKINEFGRSMVEMLGVLAIIGVLSVGAIAGYSKAMFKYKLNKQVQQLNTVFNTAARYNRQLKFDDNTTHFVTNTFIKLGEIAPEMIKSSDNHIYDIFNNDISLVVYGTKYTTEAAWNPAGAIVVQIKLTSNESDYNIAMCRNIINVAKENKDNVWYLETIGVGDERLNTSYYGDSFCNNAGKCISTLDINKIDAMCRGFAAANVTNPMFYIWWK